MSHQKAPIRKALKRLPSVTKERACEAARHCTAVDLMLTDRSSKPALICRSARKLLLRRNDIHKVPLST